MGDYSISWDTVVKFWIVLKQLINLLEHLFSVLLSQFFTALVNLGMEGVRLNNFPMLFFSLLPCSFPEKPVSLK
jgi:hypothetical protein